MPLMINPDDVKYIQYIQNTGGRISSDDFCEDWEPIGSDLINRLVGKGLIKAETIDYEVIITLTDKAKELLDAE